MAPVLDNTAFNLSGNEQDELSSGKIRFPFGRGSSFSSLVLSSAIPLDLTVAY